jgi:hypothetical protein
MKIFLPKIGPYRLGSIQLSYKENRSRVSMCIAHCHLSRKAFFEIPKKKTEIFFSWTHKIIIYFFNTIAILIFLRW